jgi:RNA-directed DNA polymerase
MMQPRASIFGGSWLNDGNAGSRYAIVDYWTGNSNENLGVRGRSDQRDCASNRRGRDPSAKRSFVAKGTAATEQTLGTGYGLAGRPARFGLWPKSRSVFLAPPANRWSAYLSRFGEHTSRSGRAGRSRATCRDPRPAFSEASRSMARRYRNLIGRITSPRNMESALRLTAAGKRLTPCYLEFKEFGPLNLSDLARDMRDGSYVCGAPREFYVLDPKRRLISALPFRDRVAQQALCLVIGPIFDAALLPRSFACRPGKGTHAGVVLLQSELRREQALGPLFFLKTDFSAYFASIERKVLWRLIEAKISCRATLGLIEAMVPRAGVGLPIGSLTSQIFANLYTGATLDRHLQQTLGERLWFRYMDDIVVLGRSSAHLRLVKAEIERFAAAELGLRFSKWQIASVSRGVNFLGYRIWSTHKLLRKDSVVRARRKIRAYRAAGDHERLRKFLAAWLGHARWADSANLIRSLGLGAAS